MTRLQLAALALAASAAGPTPLTAQIPDSPPPDMPRIELERSRTCVATLAEVEVLDVRLDPLAARSRRLMSIAQAIALEDRSVTGLLDPSNPVESDVRAWFATDSLLAVRYLENQNPALQEQRAAGRESIKAQVSEALEAVGRRADSVMAESGDLVQRAGPCDGAVFVRPAVLEACAGVTSELCTAAAQPPDPAGPYRFVDEPADVWELRELRPWTDPSPLAVGPSGLDGGRTIGYARVGNVVVTAAFTALLKDRAQATPAELTTFEQNNQALAITFDHPDIAFTPALALRAALPQPLGGEDRYLVHFGDPDDPDVVWSAAAGSGAPLEASLPISPVHALKLRDGEPLTLTAARGDDSVYSITLTEANQVTAVSTLLGYMATQLGVDLRRIAPPNGDPTGGAGSG